jgi:hypothetical protein
MIFEPINFEQLNETDVREEILAPLLRRLGYRSGTINNVIREQSLRYPKIFLGRKDPKRDPELRGKADYICEADGKVRWTIEAKSPAIKVAIDDIEQAYSYSNHPEVRAVYFCISNGHEFRVYQTNLSPQSPPLLSILYEEFNEKFDVIKNLLSPAAICLDWPAQTVDFGKPIGPGLRSVARITGGYIQYVSNTLDLAPLKGLTDAITGGAVERNENSQLVAFIEIRSPYAQLQRFNERLGLSRLELISSDTAISIDRNKPTIFSLSQRTHFSAGEKLFNLQTWSEITLPFNMVCDATTSGQGILVGQNFKGAFRQKLRTDFSNIPRVLVNSAPNIQSIFDRLKYLEVMGDFEAHLA